MFFKMMAVAASAFLVLPAFAQTEPAPPVASDAPAKPKKEKKICHYEPAPTGSNMPRVTCRTAAQWAKSQGNAGDGGATPGVRPPSGDSADSR